MIRQGLHIIAGSPSPNINEKSNRAYHREYS